MELKDLKKGDEVIFTCAGKQEKKTVTKVTSAKVTIESGLRFYVKNGMQEGWRKNIMAGSVRTIK